MAKLLRFWRPERCRRVYLLWMGGRTVWSCSRTAPGWWLPQGTRFGSRNQEWRRLL